MFLFFHDVTIAAPEAALEATIRMSDKCREMGQARGNLLPLLSQELDHLLGEDVHEVFNNREGFVGLAYREVFPRNKAILDTYFDSKEHVIDSICNSSMFPFFSTNFPCRLAKQKTGVLPRVVVDGYFSVDRNRFGCPDFDTMDHYRKLMNEEPVKIERTISLSVFPHDFFKIDAFDSCDQISPLLDNPNDIAEQMSQLLRLATQCGTKDDYFSLYEQGWKDAERWITEEKNRNVK